MASGLDRGLSAYCWPRDALWVASAMERLGHAEIGKGVLQWLNTVRVSHLPFLYWFQKYSIDGVPEWETPAIDQTAMIPWSLERYYRVTGDLDFVSSVWPMVEQAALVCHGDSGGHPGLYDGRVAEPDQLGRHGRPDLRLLPLFQRLRGGRVEGCRPARDPGGSRRDARAAGRRWPTGSGTRASSASRPRD